MTSPAVVRSGANGGSGSDFPVTLASAPTDGDFLIGFVYRDDGGLGTGNVNGWTFIAKTTDSRGGLYKRVASGLVAALPSMTSGLTGYSVQCVYEVSNADTVDVTSFANGASVTTLTVGPTSTVAADTLALLFVSGWFAVFGTNPTINGGNGWTQDRSSAFGTALSLTSGHQSLASASTSFQGTASWGATSQAHCAGAEISVYAGAPAVTPGRGLQLLGVG